MIYKTGDRIYVKDGGRTSETCAATIVSEISESSSCIVRFDKPIGNPTAWGGKELPSTNYLQFKGVPEDTEPYYLWIKLNSSYFIYEHKIANTKISKKLYSDRIYKETEDLLWISPPKL